MNVSISLDPGPARSSVRARRDPADADRLIIHFAPPPGRRLVGLGLGCWATVGSVGGLRGDGGVLATVFPFAVLAAVIAFGSVDLVLDRRRSRVESVWRLVGPVARFEEARGSFSSVVVACAEEVREKDDATVRETSYPVVLKTEAGTTALHAFPSWEAAVDFGELAARFLRVDFRDEVEGRSVAHDRLDEPLATSLAQDPTKPRGRTPSVAKWTGTDELVLDLKGPGLPTVRPLLGLMAIVAIVWTPLALLAGEVFAGLLPLILLAGAAVKTGWGYGSRVVANPRGLVVESFGLLGRRRHEIPIAELESILLLHPEWGGPRGLLAEFLEGIVVARSDRVSARFGHGLGRRGLLWIVEYLRRLFVRVGREQSLKAPPPEPLRSPDPVLPVIGAGLLCGMAGAWAGPPASFCLNLPLLSMVLNVAGVSGALIARFLTRRSPPAAGGHPAVSGQHRQHRPTGAAEARDASGPGRGIPGLAGVRAGSSRGDRVGGDPGSGQIRNLDRKRGREAHGPKALRTSALTDNLHGRGPRSGILRSARRGAAPRCDPRVARNPARPPEDRGIPFPRRALTGQSPAFSVRRRGPRWSPLTPAVAAESGWPLPRRRRAFAARCPPRA